MENLEESEAETSYQLFHVLRGVYTAPQCFELWNVGLLWLFEKFSRPSRVRNTMENLEESEAEDSYQLFHVLRYASNYGMLD